MGIIWAKIFPPKEDNSAAVKKQAEGASNPMYALASLVSSHTMLLNGLKCTKMQGGKMFKHKNSSPFLETQQTRKINKKDEKSGTVIRSGVRS